MKNIIKTILFEWKERELPKVIERETDLSDYLRLKIRKIVAVTGFRRAGKTYLVFGLIKKLLKERKKEEVLYVNFEDERIPEKTEFLTHLLPTIKETFGKLPEFLFLDEIQNIPNWSKWLRRVYDKEKINFFVTGSSSKMSSKEIPTELRGRCLVVEVFPLSFREFLRFKQIEIDLKALLYSESQRAEIMRALSEYLYLGGMPEVVLAEESKKKEILHQYFGSVIRRDIIERFNIRNEEGLRTLLQLLLNSTSFSITRLYNNLKSLGLKIGKTTLSHYLSYIENSYFINTVPIFSYKIRDRMQYPRKVYFIDNGFISTLSLKFSKDWGRLYENLVFSELKRRNSEEEIFYWRDRQQKEVDFLLKKGLKPRSLVQVCYDVSDFEARNREIKNLLKASRELEIKNLLIVTKEKEGKETVKGKEIRFISLWKWLLKQQRG